MNYHQRLINSLGCKVFIEFTGVSRVQTLLGDTRKVTPLQLFPNLVAPGRAAYTLARQTCRLIGSMISSLPVTKIIPFEWGILGLCICVAFTPKLRVLNFGHSHLPGTAMRARAGTVPTSKTILKHELYLTLCIRSDFWIPVCLLLCSMGEP